MFIFKLNKPKCSALSKVFVYRSQTVWPDEFLGNGFIRNVSEFFQEGTSFEVEIEAVSEAELFLAQQYIRFYSERKTHFASAFLVTS